jgi:hypothetical protein
VLSHNGIARHKVVGELLPNPVAAITQLWVQIRPGQPRLGEQLQIQRGGAGGIEIGPVEVEMNQYGVSIAL